MPDFPTLANHRWLRFITLGVMYAAQGLPFGLFNISIPSWMASQDYAAADIAWFIGIVSLPWSLKLLAAPVMDRWTFLPMGYRRPWVMAAQFGVMVSFLLMGLIPVELTWLAVAGFATNTFAATQDVAVDGMAIDILDAEDRARANAFMFGGQFLGISLGSSGGGYALLYLGVPGLALLSAGLMLVILMFPILLLERPGERQFPWSKGMASPRQHTAESFFKVIWQTLKILALPASILLLLAQAGGRLAEGMVIAHLPIVLVQGMGLEDTTYNNYSTVGGVVSAIIGLLVSPWFDKINAHRAYWLTCTAFTVVILLIPYTLEAFPMATIVAHWITLHLMGITLIATMMRFCRPEVAATQFAVYMAMANLGYSAGSFLYREVIEYLNNVEVMWFAGLLAGLALPLWYLLLRNHMSETEPPGEPAQA